jgi:hypothetical protein
MSWPVAYRSIAWPIPRIVVPIANSTSGAPGGSRGTRATAASAKSTCGRGDLDDEREPGGPRKAPI